MKQSMTLRLRRLAITGLISFAAVSLASADAYIGWNNYQDFIMNPSAAGITTNQVRFPLLIRLNGTNAAIFKHANSPNDLRFAKGSNLNTIYPFQVEEWDTLNRQAAVWVLVDTVFAAAASQGIRMYWGNDTASAASSGTAVFDTANGFAGVYHFSNNTNDATAFARNATASSTTDTVGLIGHAQKYIAANNDSVMIPGLMGNNAVLTISLWTRVDAISGSADAVDLLSLGDNAAIRVVENTNAAGTWDSLNGFYYGNGTWRNTLSPGGQNILGQGWQYLAYVVNPSASTEQVYLNGKLVASSALNYAITYTGRGANTVIGHHANGNAAYYGLGGLIDEPRVDKVARSADWLALCFATQSANESVVLQVPGAPALASPTSGAVNQMLSPTLAWNATGGATSYTVLVSTTSAFTTTVFTQQGVSSTSLAAAGLANGTTYYWEVNAEDLTLTGPWSATWSFTTTSIPLPVAPSLASPTNAAANLAVNLTLNWNTVYIASSYGVQVSTGSAFTTTVFAQSGLTAPVASVSGLANGRTFYWRADAANPAGSGAWSAIWTFGTIPATGVNPVIALPRVQSGFQVRGMAVEYSLASAGAVEITVSDILGRTAFTMNRMQSAGHFALDLRRCSLAAGRYLITFKSAGIEQRASLMITK
jgi:hypothetical protein